MQPYKILQINPESSTRNLRTQLRAFGNFSDEKIVEMLNGKSEEDQREFILEKLIEVKYYFLCENMKKKIGKQRAGQNISIVEIQKEVRKHQMLLAEAYQLIDTKEKREQYAKNVVEQEALVAQKTKAEPILTQAAQFLQSQASKREIYTKYVPSKEELEQKKQRNKARLDPENRLPNYKGEPYQWGVTIEQKNILFLEGKNDRGETILITQLGKFQFENTRLSREQGRMGFFADMIGITKLDEKGKSKRTDIMIAKLNRTDKEIDREFFKNIFCADELIDHAKANNKSYMGSVCKTENELGYQEYGIEYNGICDTELVTVLELAEYTSGQVGNERKRVPNFAQLREKLMEIQNLFVKQYVQQQKESKTREEGEEK